MSNPNPLILGGRFTPFRQNDLMFSATEGGLNVRFAGFIMISSQPQRMVPSALPVKDDVLPAQITAEWRRCERLYDQAFAGLL